MIAKLPIFLTITLLFVFSMFVALPGLMNTGPIRASAEGLNIVQSSSGGSIAGTSFSAKMSTVFSSGDLAVVALQLGQTSVQNSDPIPILPGYFKGNLVEKESETIHGADYETSDIWLGTLTCSNCAPLEVSFNTSIVTTGALEVYEISGADSSSVVGSVGGGSGDCCSVSSYNLFGIDCWFRYSRFNCGNLDLHFRLCSSCTLSC